MKESSRRDPWRIDRAPESSYRLRGHLHMKRFTERLHSACTFIQLCQYPTYSRIFVLCSTILST